MSNASSKICLAVMRGTTMRLPIQIAWQGNAETTFDVMCSTYALMRVRVKRNGRHAQIGCFVYIAKATSFDDSFSIYKVGVTKNLKERMQQHAHIPVLRWSEPLFAGCDSSMTATHAENAMLASAAAAGFWVGCEWIAGCNVTQARLAVSKETTRIDGRYRVRANQEFSHGTGSN